MAISLPVSVKMLSSNGAFENVRCSSGTSALFLLMVLLPGFGCRTYLISFHIWASRSVGS